MRDHPVMGPIEVSPSLSIPRQTYSAADSHLSFLPSDFVCPDGQLPAVQQGSANEPRQKQNQVDGLRASCHKAFKRIQYERIGEYSLCNIFTRRFADCSLDW